MSKSGIDNEIERFAKHIASEAQKDGVKLGEKLKAFQVLTAYYSAATRANKKGGKMPDDEDGDGANFDNFRRSLHAVSGVKDAT